MFSLGLQETFFIIAIIIIFLNPKEYPKIIKKCATIIRKINTMWVNITNNIDLYDDNTK